jgi:hypothetical protein
MSYQERMARAKRKKNKVSSKIVMVTKHTNEIPSLDYPERNPSYTSRDTRVGSIPPTKRYENTKHTVAPAYNKGAYQVIPKSEIKDIGR